MHPVNAGKALREGCAAWIQERIVLNVLFFLAFQNFDRNEFLNFQREIPLPRDSIKWKWMVCKTKNLKKKFFIKFYFIYIYLYKGKKRKKIVFSHQRSNVKCDNLISFEKKGFVLSKSVGRRIIIWKVQKWTWDSGTCGWPTLRRHHHHNRHDRQSFGRTDARNVCL